MKKILILVALVLGLSFYHLFSKLNEKPELPLQVKELTDSLLKNIHQDNINSCFSLLNPELNNQKTFNFISELHDSIQSLDLDSFFIIHNEEHTLNLYEDTFDIQVVSYRIYYEYQIKDSLFLNVKFLVQKHEDNLVINGCNANFLKVPFKKLHEFNFQNKSFLHYLFLFFAILILFFVLISLFFVIKTKLRKKVWWIIGVLLGFMKFSLHWSTGVFGFKLITVLLFSAGYSSLTIYLSVPFVAIFFWYKHYKTIFKKNYNPDKK